MISEDPEIRTAAGFLSEAECAYLRARAQPLLQPSMIIDDRTGRPRPHPFRTSMGMNFDPTQEDLVVHAINRRIAALTGTDVRCGEPLHVLHYTGAQEFRPHLDAVPGAANQRVLTVLVYLSDGYGGGETDFPELALTTKGRTGDALVFRNADATGQADPRAIHAGRPVSRGEKWLASRWIRQAPYEAEVLGR